MEYTKREWKTVKEGNGYWKIYGENDSEVAVAYNAKTDKVLEANAHLIAAAPDMYEALKEGLKLLDINLEYNRGKVSELLRQALAKAEGK